MAVGVRQIGHQQQFWHVLRVGLADPTAAAMPCCMQHRQQLSRLDWTVQWMNSPKWAIKLRHRLRDGRSAEAQAYEGGPAAGSPPVA